MARNLCFKGDSWQWSETAGNEVILIELTLKGELGLSYSSVVSSPLAEVSDTTSQILPRHYSVSALSYESCFACFNRVFFT